MKITKALIALSFVMLGASTAHADSGASAATRSDTDADILDITGGSDSVKTVKIQPKFKLGAYRDKDGKTGTGVQLGYHNPTYIAGDGDIAMDYGLLAPVVSGAKGSLDVNADKKLENYSGELTLTGFRLRDRYYSGTTHVNTYAGDYKDRANGRLQEVKDEYLNKGYDVSNLSLDKIGEYDGYRVDGVAVPKGSKPYATDEIELGGISLVANKRGKLGFSERGISGRVVKLDGHVAFTINGQPIDVCGQLSLLKAVYGNIEFGKDQSVDLAYHYVEGSACAGTRFNVPLLGTFHVRDEASVDWGTKRKDVQIDEETKMSQRASYVQYSNSLTIDRKVGQRRVGLYYDYSRERVDGFVPGDSQERTTNSTHMVGVQIR